MMSKHLLCVDSNSSARYFGRAPQTGDAYLRSIRELMRGRINCTWNSLVSDAGILEENRVLTTGVEPMTFRLLVWMLYH